MCTESQTGSEDKCFAEDRAIFRDERAVKKLLETEAQYMPGADYMARSQSNLQPFMRRVVATWMLDVSFAKRRSIFAGELPKISRKKTLTIPRFIFFFFFCSVARKRNRRNIRLPSPPSRPSRPCTIISRRRFIAVVRCLHNPTDRYIFVRAIFFELIAS